jgi:superfamily II DNA or RNA helicase
VVENSGVAAQKYNQSVEKQGNFSESLGNSPAIQPRPYQKETIDGMARASVHHRAVLGVSPTASGKTITMLAKAARIITKRKERVYLCAHRIELCEQAAAKAAKMGLEYGFIAAGKPTNPGALLQICMVQSLARRLNQISDNQYPSYLMVDEAHHATAGTYRQIMDAFPHAKVFGYTAPPRRADGTGMGDVFGALVQVTNEAGLIAQGYLSKPRYRVAPADLTGIRTQGGEYSMSDAEKVYSKRSLYRDLIGKWFQYAEGQPTVVFNPTVKVSKEIAAEFCERGVPAVHLDADTDPGERRQILEDFASGKYLVICNVALFTEGWDAPNISCVILNRPTQSWALYMQMVGRGARPTAGFDATTAEERLAAIAASSKPHFLVIDLGGNLKEHGFWEQPIQHTLDGSKKSRKKKDAPKDVAPMRECPVCGLYAPQQARECEECHYTYPTLQDRLKSAEFVEVQYGAAALVVAKTEKVKKITLWPEDCRHCYHKPALLTSEQLKRVERAAGYKPGWAASVEKRRAAWQEGGVRP